MSDGRAPKDVLYHRIIEALSLVSDLDLCRRIMGGSGMGRSGIAALANVVSAAATDGDIESQAILWSAARELASLAIGLRKVLGFPSDERTMVSWSGGVLSQEPLVRNAFERI